MDQPKTVQVNIRIRETTKAKVQESAMEDRRSMADQFDVLVMEALQARAHNEKRSAGQPRTPSEAG